ncbi:hypothetical protein [Ideonella sp.]|uniref:hypothetical protein n=1 Tax=Ideonella sp. TaxID=1929293 RepID=UPI003BB4B1A9
MQLAVAAYACPKLESPAHAMQMAGMVMDDAVDMVAMPDCHAMPGSMDEEAPQLCRAHCGTDSQPAPSVHAPDFHATAALALWLAYVLPTILEGSTTAERQASAAESASAAGFPPLYLTLQVLRN